MGAQQPAQAAPQACRPRRETAVSVTEWYVRRRGKLARGTATMAHPRPDVAGLVDAHGSGPCGGNPVEVQVLSSALGLFAGVSRFHLPAESPLSPRTSGLAPG